MPIQYRQFHNINTNMREAFRNVFWQRGRQILWCEAISRSSGNGTASANGNFFDTITEVHRHHLMLYVACDDVPVYKLS
jgi:hypothetical protein